MFTCWKGKLGENNRACDKAKFQNVTGNPRLCCAVFHCKVKLSLCCAPPLSVVSDAYVNDGLHEAAQWGTAR